MHGRLQGCREVSSTQTVGFSGIIYSVYFRAQHHHLHQRGKEKFLNRNVLDIHAVGSKTAPKVNMGPSHNECPRTWDFPSKTRLLRVQGIGNELNKPISPDI